MTHRLAGSSATCVGNPAEPRQILSRSLDPTATTPVGINVSPCFDPDYPFKEVTTDRSDYYLRKGEAPGRWTGDGARALGLAGEVSPAALRALFCGKHPVTGVYLASARGSSARAGARAGGRDLDVRAAAARLDVSADKVRALLRSGELAGAKGRNRAWRISTDALDAYEEGRPQPAALGDLPTPAADNTYSLAEAARVAGVNRSYLARLVAKGLPETTTRDDGRLVQYLVGHKDEHEKWRVAADELDRFMAGRVSARVVPAYDLAVRPPKSVSILHALGTLVPPGELVARGLPADLAGEVLAAHHAAVDDAIAVLERHAAWIRGKGGRVQAVEFTIAAFDHRSSRMGDPLLHTHLVVANVARGVDGRMAALDGTALYAWARPAGFVYQARLRAELTKRLGVEFHEPHNGVADLVGVPRAVIDLFSQRSAQRDALLAALGRSGAGAAQGAILATRPAKGVHAHQSPEQLDPAERDRLGLIRSGRSAAAIASAKAADRWHDADSADGARVALLRHWHADPGQAASDKLLVATTVAEVERLNSAARALLLADGRLGHKALVITLASPTRAVDERELRVGDRVRATRNDYLLGIRTGQVATVEAVNRKGRTLRIAVDGRDGPGEPAGPGHRDRRRRPVPPGCNRGPG